MVMESTLMTAGSVIYIPSRFVREYALSPKAIAMFREDGKYIALYNVDVWEEMVSELLAKHDYPRTSESIRLARTLFPRSFEVPVTPHRSSYRVSLRKYLAGNLFNENTSFVEERKHPKSIRLYPVEKVA